YTLLTLCFQSGRAEVWESFHTALRRLKPRPPELLTIMEKTFAGPVDQTLPLLAQLEAAIGRLSHDASPTRVSGTGLAATCLDRVAGCREALRRVVNDGRHGGAITHAIEALIVLSNDGYMTGQWDDVLRLTDEALTLCRTHGYRAALAPVRFY